MKAREELLQLRQRLSGRIDTLRAELEIVDASIRLIEREGGLEPAGAQPQQSDRTSANGEFAAMGLTTSCVRILETVGLSSPVEVRDLLIHGGYPKSDRKKLLASVYATLKRLREAGKLEARKPRGGGARKYRVKGDTREPMEK